jgi:hypothetical protein
VSRDALGENRVESGGWLMRGLCSLASMDGAILPREGCDSSIFVGPAKIC